MRGVSMGFSFFAGFCEGAIYMVACILGKVIGNRGPGLFDLRAIAGPAAQFVAGLGGVVVVAV